MSATITLVGVVIAVLIRWGRFTVLVKSDTFLGLMAKLATITMNALRTATVATIIAATQLVLTTAGVVEAMSCLLTERPVLILMSVCSILTTVLRYVGTPQVPSPVVVTLAMHCRAEDIVTILTSAPAVTAVVLTLVLTTPVHSYAVVTQGTILARTENPVTTPTSVLRIMAGVDTRHGVKPFQKGLSPSPRPYQKGLSPSPFSKPFLKKGLSPSSSP